MRSQLPKDYDDNPNIQLAFEAGQILGDLLATAMADGNMVIGEGVITWGLAEAGIASRSVVGAIPGLLTAVGGGIMVLHGAGTIAYATAGTAQTLHEMSKIKSGGGKAKPTDSSGGAEHTKGARKSTKGKHEKGQAAKQKSRGGEKGDAKRRANNKRPKGWKGTWPPK